MDGKGRRMDHGFVERLWRSLKYEDIYLRAYATGSEARLDIGRWIEGYNTTRPHQALGYRTPDEVYKSPTDDGGVRLAEINAFGVALRAQTPLADRLVADHNAPKREHLLDHPKAQRKSIVQPDRVADQLRREAVAGVGGLGRACHGRLIPTRAAQAPQPATNLTVPAQDRFQSAHCAA